jgi:hypothetical protein
VGRAMNERWHEKDGKRKQRKRGNKKKRAIIKVKIINGDSKI